MTKRSSVTQEAVFVGANRQAQVFDYSLGVVAFGAGHTVALWDPLAPDHRGVYHTLNGHTKEVTCVKFAHNNECLISGAEDGKLVLWKAQPVPSFPVLYQQSSAVSLGDCSVTAIATAGDLVVTGTSAGEIAIHEISGPSLVTLQTLVVKRNFFPTALALVKINSNYLLIVGGTSPDVYVYSFANGVESIEHCATLTGHEDWIKCLSVVTEKEGLDYILASGSQDRYIRLWRLTLNGAIDNSDEDDSKLILLSNKKYKFSMGADRAAFSFEALIMGHDDWVTGLCWHPSLTHCSAQSDRKLQLLSSSADTALMIWQMDHESGVWVSVSRLGELSIKGASTATGASGGFWSCLWFQDDASRSQYILASGKTGAIRAYKSSSGDPNTWESVLGVTGPIKEVTDLVWSRDGTYFLSTSLDQTTRLFAPWSTNKPSESPIETWHEFARPQIHGYDMICADILTSSKFVSGGDEKILRVFEMTKSIRSLLQKYCGLEGQALDSLLPETASLPVLGLSNKAANEQLEAGEAQQREEDHENEEGDHSREPVDLLGSLNGPPLEDHLQRYTLFPEVEKLYGHGYEITCCATSPKHGLIASACRSNSAKHAVVRVFNAEKDLQLVDKVLEGHNLTITSMEFSPCGEYLLVVSRDRQFSLWRITDKANGYFELIEINPKAHSRIIWDCSWAAGESNIFITVSRDKTIKVWRVDGGQVLMVSSTKSDQAITSVSCYQTRLIGGKIIVAVGHESGKLSIYGVEASGVSIEKLLDISAEISPSLRVNKLAFSPRTKGDSLLLATASDDTSVRVYYVDAAALL